MSYARYLPTKHLTKLLIIFAELPYNDYYEYYGPDFRLHVPNNNMDNQNSREYLEKYT